VENSDLYMEINQEGDKIKIMKFSKCNFFIYFLNLIIIKLLIIIIFKWNFNYYINFVILFYL